MWYRPFHQRVNFTGAEIMLAASLATAAGGLASAGYQMANKPEQPKPFVPEEMTTPPNPDDADTKARLAAAQARERRRKSGSLLTNPASSQPLAQAPVQVKSLLGQ